MHVVAQSAEAISAPGIDERFVALREAEITAQPRLLADLLEVKLGANAVLLEEAGLLDGRGRLADLERIVIVSEGSALNAGLLAGQALETWAQVCVRVESASEWLDHVSILDRQALVVGLVPPGDGDATREALRAGRATGVRTLAIGDEGIGSGPRLSPSAGSKLAPSQAFVAQAALLLTLSLRLAQARRTLPAAEAARIEASLAALPSLMGLSLDCVPRIEHIAERDKAERFFFFLGRQASLATCLEGAHKLREIARIPAQAYAAGEMKHGPIALIEDGTPVVCVLAPGPIQKKVTSNLEEARARGARIILVAPGDTGVADDVLAVPAHDGEALVYAVAAAMPLQLLACRLAASRDRLEQGTNCGPAGGMTTQPFKVAPSRRRRVSRLSAKRVVDLGVSVGLLLILAPLALLLVATIKVDSRGSVLYRCRRVGRGWEEFDMLKFRKMRRDVGNAAPLTAADDDRFTRVGRFLAHSKLDEIPQLWNVVRGQMSLVGPRPEDPRFASRERRAYATILSVPPGITGLTQLAFARESDILDRHDRTGYYVTNLLPEKTRLDCLYVARRSFRLDLRILLWTMIAVLLRREVAVHRGSGQLSIRVPRSEPATGPAQVSSHVNQPAGL